MKDESNDEQLNELLSEDMFIELTPGQEAEQLVEEFATFATSLELCVDHIPEEHKNVRDKVEALAYALGAFGTDEMLILFKAMEKAHPEDFPPEEGK